MRIARELYDEIVAHARADAPDECCGMSRAATARRSPCTAWRTSRTGPLRYEIGRDGRSSTACRWGSRRPTSSSARSTTRTPRSDPYPSQTDINLAFYPDSLYLIVGLASGPEPVVKAYEIRAGRVAEAVLTVV